MTAIRTISEENYLKAIFTISQYHGSAASTNAIAERLETRASSVTDMVRKLSEKGLVAYQKYKGVMLTDAGNQIALNIIRKHRLWEVFLVEKLHFGWEEVHEIAEQLEHIQSPELTRRLSKFLDDPMFDPHGDPIPDEHGNIQSRKDILLSELKQGEQAIIVGVSDTSSSFLEFLNQKQLCIATRLEVLRDFNFDCSKEVKISGGDAVILSEYVCRTLNVSRQ